MFKLKNFEIDDVAGCGDCYCIERDGCSLGFCDTENELDCKNMCCDDDGVIKYEWCSEVLGKVYKGFCR